MTREYPPIVSIDGNIGSGKSTFLDNIALYYAENDPTVQVLKEPVEKWSALMDPDTNTSLLESYYANPITFSFPFQVYAFQTLIQSIDHLVEKHPDCRLIICERSILSSCEVFARMLHAHEIMNPLEYQIYLNLFAIIPNIERYTPKRVFYLKLDTYYCHERVMERDRKGEGDISMDYLDECSSYYDSWLKDLEIPYKIHELDKEPGLEQIKQSFIEFIHEVPI
jgi:deoxyadenosine/deoxycytidine kinase